MAVSEGVPGDVTRVTHIPARTSRTVTARDQRWAWTRRMPPIAAAAPAADATLLPTTPDHLSAIGRTTPRPARSAASTRMRRAD